MHTFSECDAVPSIVVGSVRVTTCERVPLMNLSRTHVTVTRKPNIIMVFIIEVVTELPTIYVSLRNVQSHITFGERRRLTLSCKLNVVWRSWCYLRIGHVIVQCKVFVERIGSALWVLKPLIEYNIRAGLLEFKS